MGKRAHILLVAVLACSMCLFAYLLTRRQNWLSGDVKPIPEALADYGVMAGVFFSAFGTFWAAISYFARKD